MVYILSAHRHGSVIVFESWSDKGFTLVAHGSEPLRGRTGPDKRRVPCRRGRLRPLAGVPEEYLKTNC